MPFTAKFSATLYLALVLAAGQRLGALAVNDWSVPCTQGKCSWDLPTDSAASGTVHIWGSPSAISDITNATGWQITTSCDPSATSQDIQLVCNNGNPDCDHLFQGGGAVNTIVRLPDNCGPMPFARVAQHRVNQSNLSSRASEAPVHELALDTNFTAASSSQNDSVHFSVQGTNLKNNTNMGSPAGRRRGHRRVWSLANSRDNIHRPNFLANAPRGFGSFHKSLSANPAPVDFSGVTNLFNTTIECPAKTAIPITPSASVSLDIGADVHVTVGLSASASGTLFPPKIAEFGLNFALDGNIDANLSIIANISGKVSSGSITLFQIGIPGLSFPGLLEIGPEFKLLSHIDAKFGLNNINAVVDLNYDLSGVSFVFPPQAGSKVSGIKPSAKHVKISSSQEIGATFEATGHLIPQVDVGVSALGGKASTSVFLNLDASTDFTVSTTSIANPQPCLTASADLNVGVGAQGSFFSLFDASVGKSLFDKKIPLFQKCFAAANSTSTSTAPPATVTLSRRHHAAPQARHPSLFGGSFSPRHAKRLNLGLDLGCPLSLKT